MRVLISVDMEGVAGIATRRQIIPGRDDYEAGRHLMTHEATAAVEGAFLGGASEVVVNDSHGPMDNLLGTLLDPRAEYVVGSPKPLGMVECLEEGIDMLMLVGYHAGPDSTHGVLGHSFSSAAFKDLRLNDASLTEAELNGLVAGSFEVPVGLVTGDAETCDHAKSLFRGAVTVPVKSGIGVTAARTVNPSVARERIRAGAAQAVRHIRHLSPLTCPPTLRLVAEFRQHGAAETAALLPGTSRLSASEVTYDAATPPEALSVIMAWSYLSAGHVAAHS